MFLVPVFPEEETEARRGEITFCEVTQGATAPAGVGTHVSDGSLRSAGRVLQCPEGSSGPPLFPQETGMLP